MKSELPYPRVLIVSPVPMPRSGATGQTLFRLFQGWPADRIAQVAVSQGPEESWIADTFMASKRVIPLDSLARRSRAVAAPSAAPPPPAISLNAHSGSSLRMRLHRQISSLVDISPVVPDRSLRQWVRGYAPDVVYSALGNVRMLSLATDVADIAGCPLVPHFMDDWPHTLHHGGELAGVARLVMRRGLKRMFGRTKGGMTISAYMAGEYERRYSLPFRDFMNCVDDAWFSDSQSATPADRISFVYCGGLHLGREQVLLRLGEAIERANGSGDRCDLIIYTPDAARFSQLFERLNRVRLQALAPAEVRPALARADVLVHVESFVPAHIEYTRFSISTKVPEYLASGKAILGIGPGELASVQHLDRSGAALIHTSMDVDGLQQQAVRLLDPDLRRRLGSCGRAYALECHSASSVRERFRASLAEWSRDGSASPPSRSESVTQIA